MATPVPILTDDQLEETLLVNQPPVNVNDDDSDLISNLPLADYDHLPDYSEQLLFSWVAPERVYRPRLSKKYLRNLILLLVLIVILLIFTYQFALLIVVLALVFLAYVLVNVPPQKVRHSFTNYGIYTGNRFYSWLDRGKRFWWEIDHDQKKVIIETKLFPYRLTLLVGHPRNEKFIGEVLTHYLILQKPPLSDVDKFIAWCKKKFPLE